MKDKNQNSQRRRNPGKSRTILLASAVIIVVGMVGFMGFTEASKKPSFCTACHIMEPYYQSWKDSALLAHAHAEEGLGCLDCHHSTYKDKAVQGVQYVSGNYEEPLQPLDFPREQCMECHDIEQVAVNTDHGSGENPHASPHWSDMECNLCHSMHQTSEVYCAQCHDFEWIAELDESWVK